MLENPAKVISSIFWEIFWNIFRELFFLPRSCQKFLPFAFLPSGSFRYILDDDPYFRVRWFFHPTFHAKSPKPLFGDFNDFPTDSRRLSIRFSIDFLWFSISFSQSQSALTNFDQFQSVWLGLKAGISTRNSGVHKGVVFKKGGLGGCSPGTKLEGVVDSEEHATTHASKKGCQKVVDSASTKGSQKGTEKLSCCGLHCDKKGFSQGLVLRTHSGRVWPPRRVPYFLPLLM